MATPPSKRRRRDGGGKCSSCAKKKHLYLALDDWTGGYSIYKLDTDDMPDDLPEPTALLFAAIEHASMAFAAVGTTIFVATNPYCGRDLSPLCLVYDTEAGALTVGPRLPYGHLSDFGKAMAVGERLYFLTRLFRDEILERTFSLQVLSWARVYVGGWQSEALDPRMAWTWRFPPAPTPLTEDEIIKSFAVHPDEHTVFMSTSWSTYSLDTDTSKWQPVGDNWVLPFRGQAYFDGDLDA